MVVATACTPAFAQETSVDRQESLPDPACANPKQNRMRIGTQFASQGRLSSMFTRSKQSESQSP
jgi:hypothetical protein